MINSIEHSLSPDHRRQPRHRTFLGGKLVFGDGAYSVDCVVRDITADGARIKLPDGQAIPDKVYFVEIRSGVAYEARVTWKQHPEIGLQFLHQHGLEAASMPHLMIMKQLWTEHRERPGSAA